jgi:hypothetical protein
MDKYQDPKQPAASRTMSASQMQTGTSPRWVVTPPTPRDSGTDPNPIVATIALRQDGDVAWVDYENGDYVVDPLVDFSEGKAIDLEELGVRFLANVTSYALLDLRKADGARYFCYVKTPRWW